MFVCAGFAMIPLIGASTPANEMSSPLPASARLPEGDSLTGAIRLRADPFSRALPLMPKTKISRSAPASKKEPDMRVIAIVSGLTPHALLSFANGSTQIVGIGDAVERTRITSIVSDTVVLADGRRLKFSERAQ